MARQRGGLHVVRRTRLGDAAKELVAGLLALAPAVLSLRERRARRLPRRRAHRDRQLRARRAPRAKEHERCGSHLVGPLLARPPPATSLASRAPLSSRPAARLAATLGAVAASTEIFGWMQRHPEHRLARALAQPGHELQHRIATAEPSPEQLEVAEAALAACLELELEPSRLSAASARVALPMTADAALAGFSPIAQDFALTGSRSCSSC